MATKSVEQLTSNAKTLTNLAKDNVEVLTKSSAATITGIGSLAKACQDLVTRNFETLHASIQALSSVKTPQEFFEVQQKLVKEGFEAAVADSRAITELTTSVFTAAFEPMQKQVEAIQNIVKKAA